jgi:hypothetical protein
VDDPFFFKIACPKNWQKRFILGAFFYSLSKNKTLNPKHVVMNKTALISKSLALHLNDRLNKYFNSPMIYLCESYGH